MGLFGGGRLSLNIGGRREVGVGRWEVVPKHWWEERGGIEMGGCPITLVGLVGGGRLSLNIGGRIEVGDGRLSIIIGGKREVGLFGGGRLSLNIGGRIEVGGGRLSLDHWWEERGGLRWEVVPKHWWEERGGRWEVVPKHWWEDRGGRWEVVPKHWWEERGGRDGRLSISIIGGRRELHGMGFVRRTLGNEIDLGFTVLGVQGCLFK